MLNFTSSPFTRKVRWPSRTSINACPVAKNGLPRIMGTSLSSSMSRTTKSTGKMNLSIFTSTSSRIPRGKAIDLSAICKEIEVGVRSPMSSLLRMDEGMRLILAPRSHSAFSIMWPPIEQGIVKLPGSFSFSGNFL